jgi:hypothetical protein
MTKKPLPRWRVMVIAKKGEPIDTVEAATADAAIERVKREYEIAPARAKRLAAVRVA